MKSVASVLRAFEGRVRPNVKGLACDSDDCEAGIDQVEKVIFVALSV